MLDAQNAIKITGEHVKSKGIHKDFQPLVFVFTGNGKVSKGAQQIFNLLPHKFVHPKDLPNLHQMGIDFSKTLVGCVVESEHYAQSQSGPFSMNDFIVNPQKYQSNFYSNVPKHQILIFQLVCVDSALCERHYQWNILGCTSSSSTFMLPNQRTFSFRKVTSYFRC